jgi:hypothetical protein
VVSGRLDEGDGMKENDTPRRMRTRLLRWASILVAVPTLYVGSYFVLGEHQVGETFILGRPVSGRYTYHDRLFPFDPLIYRPLARLEYSLRGKQSQVVIKDGRYRGGEPVYLYGPYQ